MRILWGSITTVYISGMFGSYMAFSYSFPSHTVPHVRNNKHRLGNCSFCFISKMENSSIHQIPQLYKELRVTFSDCVPFFMSSRRSQCCRREYRKQNGINRDIGFQLPWLNLGRITSWIKRAKKSRLMTHSRELSWARGDEWSKSNTKEEGKMLFQWKLYFTQAGHITLIALFTLCGIARHVHDSINFPLFRTRQTLLELRNRWCWQLLTFFFT